MSKKRIPERDSVVRLVGWAKLRKDENDNVLGVLPGAFSLRDNEDYLSAAWLNYFDGEYEAQKSCVIKDLRSARTAGPKARYWIARVKDVTSLMEANGVRIRVIHEPMDNMYSHAALRRWPRDDELLEILAADVVCELASHQDSERDFECSVRKDLLDLP